ncbi:MAG: vitamin K epoxide reductase family protein [Actinomycetota bacterium]|nr:vitamin K epoxide reductase family protein [Actinomycetota bacterium]
MTRPMARQAMSTELEDHPDAGEAGDGAQEHDDEAAQAHQRLVSHHRHTLWIPWTLVLLGIWMVLAPITLGYRNPELWAVPSGGRGVWFSDATHDSLRAWLLTWSDVISGALLIVLGWRALRPDRPVSRWLACGVGCWLIFAPIVLWSPSAAGFANDSIVGLVVIALTILIPGMPNMVAYMQMGPATPPGWSYNPSSWAQRWILIALGFAGLVVSRYLGAYQLGYIDWVWDPFFGFAGGTEPILDSDMSHMWPISDAGLGAVAYSFEFLMGWMGGTARWRTMPWMVTIFGILVIPLGLAHIVLVMSQPVVVHQWCTLCLAAAAIMLPMIPLEIDEVVAMVQHVRDARRRGDRGGSSWKIFWLGGTAEGCTADERSPAIEDLPERPGAVGRAMIWGFSVPPTLAAAALVGVWLLAAPAVFGVDITSGAADAAHLGGAAVLVVAVTAMGEVVRPVRLVNLAVAAVVTVTVWLASPDVAYGAVVTVSALAAAALSWPRGEIRERYAGWNAALR